MAKLPPVTKRDAGYYLRVWRAERDLTRAQAASAFGITPSFWSLIEDGKRFAAPALAKLFAEATGEDIEIFLNMGGK